MPNGSAAGNELKAVANLQVTNFGRAHQLGFDMGIIPLFEARQLAVTLRLAVGLGHGSTATNFIPIQTPIKRITPYFG